ncbi:hypothetical protein TRFO_10361 [Tritrichomonas foetus]|uniref:Uncharacterized protein n=1 Tax=Tritrichomonas foetus TaxID=1144522 RepID=A0A1J4J957_9EUKA|nr:hypothetical protein TRFO_10361 [Tritrichomonas foetus]|eukprot:OHS95718.1 hypothetical protein TRFO_10361 [Tritrichomonas foetus]
MISINLFIKNHDSAHPHKPVCAKVLKTQRVIILNQYVTEPVKFVHGGRILELFDIIESYGIENGDTIIGIPDDINRILDTAQKERVILQADTFFERINLRRRLKEKEETHLARLHDVAIIQRIRRNGKIVRRFALYLKQNEASNSNVNGTESHSKTVFDEINCHALEPSTQPLPVLW